MRVLEVSPYGLAEVSGVTAVVLELARGFAGRGHEVTVAAPGPAPLNLPTGVVCRTFHTRGPFQSALFSLQVAGWLWRHRRNWGILHAHQGHVATLAAATVFRLCGRPVVTTFHLLPPEPPGIRGVIQRFAFRNTARMSTQRVYVSDDTRSELQGNGIVIRNGVDVDSIRSQLRNRDSLRRELGLEGCVIAFSGRVAHIKGYPDLLRATRRARDAGRDVRLLVTGRTPAEEREQIIRAVRDSELGPAIVDLGDRGDHVRFLAAADVFALPSYREGLPIALLEAMAAGLPVVVSRVGGMPEVVEEGSEGFLVPAGDVDALADRILLLASNPALRSMMARRALERAAAFDSKRVAEDYLSLFERCTAGAHR